MGKALCCFMKKAEPSPGVYLPRQRTPWPTHCSQPGTTAICSESSMKRRQRQRPSCNVCCPRPTQK